MTRLPVPNWTREGETWRVEEETAVPWRADLTALLCRHGRCRARAVAGYTTRSGEFHPMCAAHLAEQRMWIEDGRVVSWCLRP